MKAVQNSLETLSETVGGGQADAKTRTETAETAKNNAKEASGTVKKAEGTTTSETSDGQLSDQDYYVVQKGETLIDTAETINAMGTDILVMRHNMSGAPHLIAPLVSASVINAGDGMDEHPTQALLDMLTIKEKKGGFKGLKVAIIGDIYHSRVVRSNVYGLTKLGADVSVGGPTTLMPPGMERLGVKVFNNVEDAIKDADVVMGLRIQLERQKKGLFPSIREYYRFFGVDNERLKLAKPGALVMHPGPVNRGVEFSSSVIDGEQSVINEQVTNGVAVRMAVMYILSRGGFED